ncbi:hypothetical protein [Streptomyces sp. NPDC050428]|uniref:hypothetical protein n=1 Tax=Streptomyces sp. NPDC050428 TaxID=3155757 RepID=UPI00341FF27A
MGTGMRTDRRVSVAVTTALTAGALLLAGTGPATARGAATGAATAAPSDPAPGGPQRPYEPDVPGPRNIDTLSVAVTPDGGTRRGVRVGFDRTSRSDAGGAPAGARRFVFLFDESLDFRPDAFPVCAREVIETAGVDGCPDESQVGRGTSHVYPEGTADVVAFNTRHANGLRGALVVIPASGTILELTWERVTAEYRQRGYGWALDEILPVTAVPPQDRAGTLRFQLEWGATRRAGDGRGVSFAQLAGERDEKLRFGLWSWFVTGQIALPRATAVPPAPTH